MEPMGIVPQRIPAAVKLLSTKVKEQFWSS